MEAIISNLVKRFETGSLSRRELIQGLTMLAAGAGAASAAVPQQESLFTSVKIDHISRQVTDLPKTIAFYRDIFGLKILNEDKPNEIVRMGATKVIVSLHHKPPVDIVDHFAIGIEKFNKEAVTQALKQRSLNPQENLDYGFYVRDPEGFPVQIVAG
jgi:catechol 2,3-dioxygenase-like lactoylglutathione lyase family enzyme